MSSVQAPTPIMEDPNLHELPPIVIDGIPTPVEKMTQVPVPYASDLSRGLLLWITVIFLQIRTGRYVGMDP